jgi:hypothetical protein
MRLAMLAQRALVLNPCWVTPTRPRGWWGRETFLRVAVVAMAPGGAARAISLTIAGPLLPTLFFLFPIQLLSEVLVTRTVVAPLAFLVGALPVGRVSIHSGENREGTVGVVG